MLISLRSYAALFAGAPDAKHLGEEDNVDLTSERFATLFKRFLVKPRLDGCVAPLVADTLAAIALFDADKPMDPFDIMYKLIYQLTHRTLGCDDVADDPALCAETLSMFSDLHATGALEVMFPWLPTPVRVRKLWGGARMHWTLQRIMKQRRESGRPGTDAMQTMMDAGDTDLQITTASPSPFFPLLLPRVRLILTGVRHSLSWRLCSPASSTRASTPLGSPSTSRRTRSGARACRAKSTPAWPSTVAGRTRRRRTFSRA